MGCCESPPLFCAASETARGIIASLLSTPLPPHPFESRMLPKFFSSLPMSNINITLALIEVFVVDFIGCIDSATQDHILQTTRAMLHGIHSIFPPPKITDHNGGNPIFERKLDKLEGLWEPVKEILGWIIDGANYTISLPEDKVQRILRHLQTLHKW